MGKQVAASIKEKEAKGFSYRKRWDLPVIRAFRELRVLMADKDSARNMYLENFIQKENWLRETHGFRGFRGRGWK